MGVSVCQWQTSCEPTESADETRVPKVWPLTVRAARKKEGTAQSVRRPQNVSARQKPAPPNSPNSANPLTWGTERFPKSRRAADWPSETWGR